MPWPGDIKHEPASLMQTCAPQTISRNHTLSSKATDNRAKPQYSGAYLYLTSCCMRELNPQLCGCSFSSSKDTWVYIWPKSTRRLRKAVKCLQVILQVLVPPFFVTDTKQYPAFAGHKPGRNNTQRHKLDIQLIMIMNRTLYVAARWVMISVYCDVSAGRWEVQGSNQLYWQTVVKDTQGKIRSKRATRQD